MKNLTNTPIKPSDVQPLKKASSQLIRIKPSKCLLALVTLLHVLIVVSFLSSSLSFTWLQIPIILLCIHLGFYWYQWRALPCYRLQCLGEHWCLLQNKKNADRSGLGTKPQSRLSIKTCYYWSRFLVILIVEGEHKTSRPQYIPIVFDCCSKDDFRFIKVISKTMLAL